MGHVENTQRVSSSPPQPWFCFMRFQLLSIKQGLKKEFQKQFINFNLHSILRSVTVLCCPTLLSLGHDSPHCPAYAYCVGDLLIGHLAAMSIIKSTVTVSQSLCSSSPYFT